MRIGIPLACDAAEAGGGYTIERDIAEAIADQVHHSRHDFTIFTRSRHWSQFRSERLRVVELDSRAIWRWKLRSWRSTLRSLAERRDRSRSRLPSRNPWWQSCLQSHGIEFVWNLAPGTPTLDLPYIAMVWDLQHRLQPYFPEVSSALEWEKREQAFRVLLQRAAFVITGNTAGQREIEQFYQVPSQRIRLLPHPTPRFALRGEASDPRCLSKWGLEPGYLFYPAQFWPHKNHVGLLRAVRVLRDRFGLCPHVVLVGSDKSNRQHVQQMAAELGVADRLHVLGFVDRDELASLYGQAAALVYLSYFGPENLPPLEAMALGCPVIASQVSGAEEQLSEAAVLVDPRNPDEIAQAIARLLRDPGLRSDLITRGRIRARKFTADDFVRGVLAMLDEFAAIRECWGPCAA